METVDLKGLLSKATVYEHWRTPIDPKLRLPAIASGPFLLLCYIGLLVLLMGPIPEQLATAWGTEEGRAVLGILEILLWVLLGLDVVGLLAYVPMLVFTSRLREGRQLWHWVAFAEAVLAGAQAFLLALGIAIAIVAALAGMVISVLLVGGGILALGAAATS